MSTSLQIIVAGRDRETIETLAATAGEHFKCEPILQHIDNGHADPLYGHHETPDLLILALAADWSEQLGAICDRPAAARPTMLVIGPETEIDAIRLAMRAGARDYLSAPAKKHELIQALSLIQEEERRHDRGPCRWTSIIGVKGGIGASMIACNLAELACRQNKDTVLLDLNLQAGSLAGYLDVEPRNSFFDAVEAAPDLDSVALEGYMSKTATGLRLLAAPADQLVLPEQMSPDSIGTVYELLADNYNHVIADVPQRLDHVIAMAIEQSDEIFLVMEQSVAALRETLRFLELLSREFAIDESRVRIVINRFSKNASVTERQIRKNLGDLAISTIPNDFRAVRESLDMGIPIVRHARNSASTKALIRLGEELTGQKPERGSFVSSLTNILRS